MYRIQESGPVQPGRELFHYQKDLVFKFLEEGVEKILSGQEKRVTLKILEKGSLLELDKHLQNLQLQKREEPGLNVSILRLMIKACNSSSKELRKFFQVLKEAQEGTYLDDRVREMAFLAQKVGMRGLANKLRNLLSERDALSQFRTELSHFLRDDKISVELRKFIAHRLPTPGGAYNKKIFSSLEQEVLSRLEKHYPNLYRGNRHILLLSGEDILPAKGQMSQNVKRELVQVMSDPSMPRPVKEFFSLRYPLPPELFQGGDMQGYIFRIAEQESLARLQKYYPALFRQTRHLFLSPGRDWLAEEYREDDYPRFGPCYLATEIFTKDHEQKHIIELQRWRDAFLLRSGWGRLAVKFYYSHGLYLARITRCFPLARWFFKNALLVLISVLKRLEAQRFYAG